MLVVEDILDSRVINKNVFEDVTKGNPIKSFGYVESFVNLTAISTCFVLKNTIQWYKCSHAVSLRSIHIREPLECFPIKIFSLHK